MKADFDAQWEALAAEVLSGMKEWRLQHPKATLPEIEHALDERLAKMQDGPTEVLTAVTELVSQHPERADLATHLAYLVKRAAHMQYPAFQAAGWPIGDGAVESGNKLVVEARLKGSGMHWARAYVDPILALRNVVCSDRWAKAWPHITQTLRRQARHAHRQPPVPVAPGFTTAPAPPAAPRRPLQPARRLSNQPLPLHGGHPPIIPGGTCLLGGPASSRHPYRPTQNHEPHSGRRQDLRQAL